MHTTTDHLSTQSSGERTRNSVRLGTGLRVAPTIAYLGIVLLIGLALRLWFISVNVIDPRFSAADDGDYYQRALRFAATGQYTDDSWLIRPPLHVFMFAGLLRLSIELGDPALGIPLIRAVHVILSLLTIIIGFDLGRRLFNRQAGYMLAAIMAIWFPLVELPALILSEPLFFYLLFIHLWLLVCWRDAHRNGRPRAWLWLLAAGFVLGLDALARSPALYGSVFSMAFIALTIISERLPRPGITGLLGDFFAGLRRRWRSVGGGIVLFVLAFVCAVGPWTARNYGVYQRFILVDTLGPVNLWLSLTPGKNEGAGEGEGKSILADIPQAERQEFVSQEISRIVSEDPGRLVRNFWPHFQHIWKAQFLEDFVVKVSFFTRPLRDIWPLGLLGDGIWFGFVSASMLALTAPLREGPFRLVAFGWIGYSALTVMLLHVEPRYLLPIWMMMAIYGAATLAGGWNWFVERRGRPAGHVRLNRYVRSFSGILGIGLLLGFWSLFFSYRNYPAIIADGIDREWRRAAAMQAYARGDLLTAEAELEAMVERHPRFVDGRVDLARILMAQERYDEAWIALGDRHTHRADVIKGAILRAQGKAEAAIAYFTDAEFRAGEDVQQLSLEWLYPAPVNYLVFGDGLDFGYVQGFSFGERLPQGDGSVLSFRWMRETGHLRVPLVEPLREGSVIRLRMAGGMPEGTPVTVRFSNGHQAQFLVTGNRWRVYTLAVPASLAGNQVLDITLRAPTFVPVQRDPNSRDARLLSVAVSQLWVD
jgi:4-amino-4-deoxy-L-arabinose transferase-like glycosyltransferase